MFIQPGRSALERLALERGIKLAAQGGEAIAEALFLAVVLLAQAQELVRHADRGEHRQPFETRNLRVRAQLAHLAVEKTGGLGRPSRSPARRRSGILGRLVAARPVHCWTWFLSAVAFKRFEPLDHCLDAAACLFVASQQARAFAGQLLLALAQAAVFLGEPAHRIEQPVKLLGQRGQLLMDRIERMGSGVLMLKLNRTPVEISPSAAGAMAGPAAARNCRPFPAGAPP